MRLTNLELRSQDYSKRYLNIQIIDQSNVGLVYNFIQEKKANKEYFSVDTETSGLNCYEDILLVIIIGNQDVQYFIPANILLDKNFLQGCRLIGHNIKFDVKFMTYNGYNFDDCLLYDTYVASCIIFNGVNYNHGLASLCLRHLNIMMDKTTQASFIGQKEFVFTERQIEYACTDVLYLQDLRFELNRLLQQTDQLRVARLEFDLMPVLVSMELEGCLIDIAAWEELIKSWETKKKDSLLKLDSYVAELAKPRDKYNGKLARERKFYDAPIQAALFDMGEPTKKEKEQEKQLKKLRNLGNINYDSTTQLKALFQILDLNPPVDPETHKTSFGEDNVLVFLTENPTSEAKNFLETLIEYKKTNKLISTYGRSFLASIKDNRIRTEYSQVFTDTGRLSSARVNLQNIPRVNEIRRCFIAPPGYSLLTADFAGQEIKIASDYSRDPFLLSRCGKDDDVHSELASLSYSLIFKEDVAITKTKNVLKVVSDISGDIEYEYISKELRDEHKSALFAIFYGGGAKRMYDVLSKYINQHHTGNSRMKIAGEIAKKLKAKLYKLNAYLEKQVKLANEQGYLVGSIIGRRRNFVENEDVYGEAMNFGIQNTGAESMKIALVDIYKYFQQKAKQYNKPMKQIGYPIMTVHDEVICCIHDDYTHLAPEVVQIMCNSLTNLLSTVKGESDYSVEKFWKK